MSERSYIAGFCKVAAAHNVDPQVLARFAVEKHAQDASAAPAGGPGYWEKIKQSLGNVGNSIKDTADKTMEAYVNAHPAVKALIGAGLGSAAGTGLGAALAGKKGLRAGSILGALAGGSAAVDWKAISDALAKMKKPAQQTSGNQ